MRLEIARLQNSLGTTAVYVTHDQVEAMTMADKIVVLNAGLIEQAGSPLELYSNPNNLFVAGFIGSPKMNLIGGRIAAEHGAATVGIRPEHITLSRGNGSTGGLSGVVQVAEHLGSDTFLYVDAGEAGLVTARAPGELGVAVGDRVGLTPEPGRFIVSIRPARR
jgi:multiple sugar transport system ATP-binding protein